MDDSQKALRNLARDIQAKTVRLRNNAALVAGDPRPGRNFTAFCRTCREMQGLIEQFLALQPVKGT